MSIIFNADEVLAIGVEIEQNGEKFYRKASEIVTAGDSHDLLARLADWEAGHIKLFTDLRIELSEIETATPTFDPDGEVGLYLNAFADTKVFNIRREGVAPLKGDETVEYILHMALEAERDAVLFYLGMKDIVPEKLGNSKVQDVINEERSHISFLQKELMKLAE